jgi:hypothetical protein
MVSTLRLNLLRAVYAMVFLFTATQFWPQLLSLTKPPTLMTGVARCLMAAMAPLMLLGVRQPLKMLPIMLFELIWKSLWFSLIGVPLWLGHQVTPEIFESLKATGLGVVLCPIVIPWGYVVEAYFKAPGERWTREGGARAAAEPRLARS